MNTPTDAQVEAALAAMNVAFQPATSNEEAKRNARAAMRAALAAAQAAGADELHLFHWSKIGDRKEVLVYARCETEAIAYLKGHPLWWNERFDPAQFKKVVSPKGPSPSILMADIGNTISAD